MEGPNPQYDYDYFTPALMDCWYYILGYILKPDDLQSLINTCALFSDMLHSRMMSELIVPTMLKSVSLPKTTLFSLRAVNKGMKGTIDAFLDKTEPEWLFESCSLSADRPQQLEIFRNHFGAFVPRGSFLQKYFILEVPSGRRWMEESVAWSLDCQISTISIELGDDSTEINFHPTAQHLSRLLRQLPGVTSLTLGITGHIRAPLVAEERQAILFPRLRLLTHFRFWSITDYDRSSENGVWRSIKILYELLIETYGSQLEKLEFDIFTWVILDLREESLSNIGYLGIDDFSQDFLPNDAFMKLSMIKAPNVRCLDLGFGSCFISTPFLPAIQNFRDSLQELCLPGMFWEAPDFWLHEVNPLTLNVFPHLMKLVVDVDDLRCLISLFFNILFPNLEEVRFDSGDFTRYRDEPTPNVNMLNKLFGLFNRLKRLVWVFYKGPSGICEELLLTRP